MFIWWTMKKTNDNSDFLGGFILVSSLILVGLIIGVFSALVITSTDKADAKRQMNAVEEYVKAQCIRYEELAAEDATLNLYNVSDKAFSLRNGINYSGDNLSEELKSLAVANRLSGVVVTEKTENPADVKIASFYLGDGNVAMWNEYLKSYGSIAGNMIKSYSDRITSDGYYYNYAIVSRGDGNGVILCYKRQSIEESEDERFSVATLLKGYVFGSDGAVVVTDGEIVLAANTEGLVGTRAADCPVVRRIRQSNEAFGLMRVEDRGVFYGTRAKSKNLFVYVYMPEASVFSKRSVVLPYILLFYLVAILLVIVLRQAMLSKKRIEQRRKDEAYRVERERLAREAIRANEAKTDFLRRMSHDIRTPINGIRGMVKIGEYYYDDLEKQKECREKIWDASGYLLDLVNDVLDMNKLTTSGPVWRDEFFVMTELLDEIESFTAVQAKETGITLTITHDITHDYLFGGKLQFKRVLTNLIGNAIKYNRPNGKVVLTCVEKSVADGKVRFECTCADTGIGIGEKFIKKMYEPFEREKQSEGKSLEGVGLGLAIVKKLVDSAGWDISVQSKKGEGTTFIVAAEFGISEQHVKTVDWPPENNDRKLNGLNILIAEDNELNLEIVEFMLKVAGANVMSATDGKQVTAMFEASEPGSIDVILMDVMMPVEDGLAATREIRSANRPDAQSVPIIAMTASAFAEDVENARTAGMNAHIAKPIDGDKLINCILRLVRKIRGGGNRI